MRIHPSDARDEAETAFLSEASLTADWNHKQEDAAYDVAARQTRSFASEKLRPLLDVECHALGLTRVDLETTRTSESAAAEFYGLLRNPAVLKLPSGAADAAAVVQACRRHPGGGCSGSLRKVCRCTRSCGRRRAKKGLSSVESHHEVDFILPGGRGEVDAIECKWDAGSFESKNIQVFRARHPAGKNIVVCANVTEPFTRQVAGLEVTFTGLDKLRV